jgi:hypothetical protein
MDLKKLKEAVNTLEKYRKCGHTECHGECVECSYNYDTADLDNSVDAAITVMNDVIKNMEKLINKHS